jgi:acid phosphatase
MNPYLARKPDMYCKIYLISAHYTDITPILAALGILIPDEDLPLDHIPFGNPYFTCNIVPQGGQFTIERLKCNATALSSAGIYVHLALNEVVAPFKDCTSGPGYTCSLEYTSIVSNNLGEYIPTCRVPSSYPQSLDFWWNYDTTTKLHYRTYPVTCQEAEAKQ